jgi:hypothetical protein
MTMQASSDRPHHNNPAPRAYPIVADLEYHTLDPAGIATKGSGRTVSIARDSVLIELDRRLPLNCPIELGVAWPVRLENKVRLKLQIHGRVSWASSARAAIQILRHEFRTVGPLASPVIFQSREAARVQPKVSAPNASRATKVFSSTGS